VARGKKDELDEEIDRLFELPPEGFIAARDEMAKRLKTAGRSADAAEVRALRRPTVAAWGVNQVARRNPEGLKELLDAGAALRQAQRKVISGVKSSGFRDAMERRRRAVTRLTKAAEQVLEQSGHSSAGAAEAAAATFEAASLDEEAAEAVRSGRLSKELPPPAGFGSVGGLELVPGTREAADTSARPDRTRESAAREARELATAAAQARRRAIKAREAADRLNAKLKRLEAEIDEARGAAREAAREAREAELDADRAQSHADRVSRSVTR